jgi:hypothetical protein
LSVWARSTQLRPRSFWSCRGDVCLPACLPVSESRDAGCVVCVAQGDPEAAKKFQEVQKAYDTLRDAEKRAAYDQLGHAGYEQMESGGGMPGGMGGPGGPFGGGVEVDPEELLRAVFGSRRGGFEVGWAWWAVGGGLRVAVAVE